MKHITSEDNKICRLVRQLEQKKYRDRYGQYLIEGENAVREALVNGVELEELLIREDRLDFYEELFGNDLKQYDTVERKVFERIAATETSQGILAVVKKPERTLEQLPSGNIVVLDRLQDPGNIGTIIRTSDAAGIAAVMAVKGTADLFSPKVVRAAAGSLFRVPLFHGLDEQETIDALKASGKKLVGTAFDTPYMYYDVDMTDNVAIVIGNEGNGMSRKFMDSCDVNIKIPMKGTIESLNASVAAGILIYETIRQEKKDAESVK